MADNSFAAFWDQVGLSTAQFSEDLAAQIPKLRQTFMRAALAIETDLPEMADVRDILVEGGDGLIQARVYTPLAAGVAPGPGIVYFHGGGFVLGDVESFDHVCRRLAAGSRCRILSVGYRRAPEYKFPKPMEDAIAAFDWAVREYKAWGVDPDRLAVAGDSAGGNLAIAVTRKALERQTTTPQFQLLIYPLTQFVDLRDKGLRLKEGPFFSPALFEFFQKSYLPEGHDPMDPWVSPLFLNSFEGLPPAHIVTAGWDPLHDEGEAYAAKLRASGVEATVRDYANQPHGFFNTTPVSIAAREAVDDAGRVVGEALSAI